MAPTTAPSSPSAASNHESIIKENIKNCCESTLLPLSLKLDDYTNWIFQVIECIEKVLKKGSFQRFNTFAKFVILFIVAYQ